MKNGSLFIIFLMCCNLTLGQSDVDCKIDSIQFVKPLEIYPKWNGGTNKELIKLITEKLVYPSEQCIEGITILQFNVNPSGVVVNPIIKRSISKTIDAQLLQEIITYQFIPGSINGRNTDFLLYFPIRIQLD